MTSPKKISITVLLSTVLLLASTGQASATWSVVGVDPDTGEVGVAMASCVELGALTLEDGFDLIALSAGEGAGVSQAAFNSDARLEIQRLLDAGQDANSIIAAITDPAFDGDPQNRQHGVVLLTGEAVGFTGEKNGDFAGDGQASNVTAQGNVLVSSAVIDDAVRVFAGDGSTPRSLGDRLVDALEAGSLAGGDNRCGDQTALFAHVSVIDRDGDRARPNVVDLTTWVERGDGNNPVVALAELYRSGQRTLRPNIDDVPAPTIPVWLWLIPLLVLVAVIGGVTLIVRKFRRRS